ncbi:MAG: hypothetical protein E3K37_14315 [Candidatus Kuenenia sp.]|nr:hypothetical protein [Candidatus Kuenenia hertensis]
MVNSEKNKYDKIINLLETRLDECNKILRNTIELKEILQRGGGEDLLIKKMQERGVLIGKASSLNDECHSINEFIRCIDDEGKKSLFEGLIKKIQQLLNETTILDKENKLLIENKMNEITLNLEKIQESKQLTRSLNKSVNDTPSFIDVCG